MAPMQAARTHTESLDPFEVFVYPAVEASVLKVDLKGTTYPYSFMPVDNLLGVWDGDEFGLRVDLEPDLSSLPDGFIVWNASAVTPPANNTRQFTFTRTSTGLEWITVEFPLLGITKSVVIEYPYVGTESQADIMLSHPFLGAAALFYGSAAQTYAEGLSMPDTSANAIQHAYWASIMASDPTIGTAYSLWVTTAHEYDNRYDDGGLAFDSVMDLHNNFVGAYVVCTDQSGQIQVGLIQSTLNQKLQAGDLWIVDEQTQMIIKSNDEKIYP